MSEHHGGWWGAMLASARADLLLYSLGFPIRSCIKFEALGKNPPTNRICKPHTCPIEGPRLSEGGPHPGPPSAATLGWAGGGGCSLQRRPVALHTEPEGPFPQACWRLDLSSSHHQESRPECKGGAGSTSGPACFAPAAPFPLTAGTS